MQNEVIGRYGALFEGRDDQYGLGGPKPDQPWKFRYAKKPEPVTPELLDAHLRGDVTIGVYCERDGLAKWFVMDFDSPKDGETELPVEGGFDLALEEAREAKAMLLREGLFTQLERSRSGNGVHLWGFVDDWVDARELAQAVFTRVPKYTTLDRGKLYPPMRESKNSILICLPYSGEAVERGGSMFLDVSDDGHIDELPLEEFLAGVRINSAAVIRELATKALESTSSLTNRPDGSVVAGASSVGRVLSGDFSGRPERPGFGIIKMLSPYGCGFMRSIWLNQHDASIVGEPEWYAFLGQLTAFKYGREAAHSLFSKHKHYHKSGMDEKYNHALQSPPMGCALIHERFPQHSCSGCPMKAPYHMGQNPDGTPVPLTKLCGESPAELERAMYAKDLERIRRLDASPEPEGIALGIPGVDQHFRLTPGEFCAIGAQPSIGKTALAVHVANSVASRGIDVAVFSAESGLASFHNRQLAWAANVDSYALQGVRNHNGEKLRLSREEWARLEEAKDWLGQLPLWENFTTSNPERIYDAFETMMCKRGKPFTDPALLLYDYFQYAQAGDDFKPGDEHVKHARNSFSFKCLSKIIEQSTVVLAQLIRESEGDDEPQINWWRGTARLEHDIDSGIILTGTRMPGQYAPRRATCVKKREGEVGWKEDLLLEQAVSRFIGKPGAAKAEDSSKLLDEPWTGAGGQTSLVGPTDD